MKLISPEESNLAGILQTEGMELGALHIASQCWTDTPQGILFSVTAEDTPCSIWLVESDWQQWCEGTLGTSLEKEVDSLLLAGIAEWALSPLLEASGAKLHNSSGDPRRCSMLNQYVVVVFAWQIDGYTFHCVLFDWPTSWFRSIAQQISPSARPIRLLPPMAFPCYAGWCQASVHEMIRIGPGTGLRMNPFGHPRDGELVALLATGSAARIRIKEGGEVKIEALVNDMESLLTEDSDRVGPASPLSYHLDSLPQKLLVEVGQIDIALGMLRTLREGDLIATEAKLSLEVKLRLNGSVLGHGELIACGDSFLVRVTQWFVHPSGEDTVNTR
ncbi:YscQ/HrcQ family type III secretion apparatus protein [Citrobacter braakii]|uniref:YscQ/HrcQ family type III secretion apparatus protein n=1 Tax=Citrobacter braakii TaxID=57706 RepID=UPI0019080A1C|nr:YscQ/HrcQ family type III secretion apparatus protein [Citrobacter braakii]MBJ9048919.1 YscQ/HrcQ family type III secretion apparatus protein [Citrobacter braakii]